MCQLLVKHAVIGDEKQYFGSTVQPSHRRQIWIIKIKKIIHNGRITVIAPGADTAKWFVEHIIVVHKDLRKVSILATLFLKIG